MTKKTAAAAEKPAVMTGTVPEWAGTGVITQLLGFKDVRRVQQLTQSGVLETEVPPGGGRRVYRTCETVQRYIAYIKQEAKEDAAQSRMEDLAQKKLEAEVALKESQSQLHRLKTAIAEGKYIPADQASEELAAFLLQFKKFALNIPPRTAGMFSGYADAPVIRKLEKAMRQELEKMLDAFSDAAMEQKRDSP